MNIYEMHGRLTEELQRVVEGSEHVAKEVIALIHGLQSGEINIHDVETNDDGWRVNPELKAVPTLQEILAQSEDTPIGETG